MEQLVFKGVLWRNQGVVAELDDIADDNCVGRLCEQIVALVVLEQERRVVALAWMCMRLPAGPIGMASKL